MDTMTILRIAFTALLCVPVIILSIFLLGKLIDQMMIKSRKQ